MITGAIAVVFVIAGIVCAENGEWGPFAVCAVIVLLLLFFGAVGRESDRAYNNFVDYWANGGEKRNAKASGTHIRNTVVTVRDCGEPEAVEVKTQAHVCHYCGRFVRASGTPVLTQEGQMLEYVCPKCGTRNTTKLGA